MARLKLKSSPRNANSPFQTISTHQDEVVICFQSDLGWMGVAHVDELLHRIHFGYSTQEALLENFQGQRVRDITSRFEKKLCGRLQSFATGEKNSFDDLLIDDSWMTPFQREVISACRDIPYGETVSYGGLAEAAGAPKAARAVGSVMSNNRFPIVVPCHRVVASGAKLGGFSSPRGVDMKLQLLQLENSANSIKE